MADSQWIVDDFSTALDTSKALEIYASLPQFHAFLHKLSITLQSMIQS